MPISLPGGREDWSCLLLYCWKATEDLGALPLKRIASLFFPQTNSLFLSPHRNKNVISSSPQPSPDSSVPIYPKGTATPESSSPPHTHTSRLALTYPLAWWGQQGALWAAEKMEAPAVSSSALSGALEFGPASCWCCWHCPLDSEEPKAPGAMAGPGTTQSDIITLTPQLRRPDIPWHRGWDRQGP